MEQATTDTSGNEQSANRVHQGQSTSSTASAEPLQTDIILDAMNITVDKHKTLVAVKQAEQDCLKFVEYFKKQGKVAEAEQYGQNATYLGVLLEQIATHGKGKPN